MKRRSLFQSLFAAAARPPAVAKIEAKIEPLVDYRLSDPEEFGYETEDFRNQYGEIVATVRYPLTRASMRAGRSDDNCGSADPQRGGSDRDSGPGA
jgi:hypothetical protein